MAIHPGIRITQRLKPVAVTAPPTNRIAVYSTKECAEAREIQASELPDVLKSEDTVVWVDLAGSHDDDAEILHHVFHFHHLAIEDTRNQRQRPKVEEYPNYLFGILNSVTLNEGEIEFREVDVFIGKNYMVTVHRETESVINEARGRIDETCLLTPMTSGYLLYVLVDAIVDSYFPILDAVGDEIEEIGDRVFDEPRQAFVERLFHLKRALSEMWRVASNQRDMFGILMRENSELINSPSLRFYFRDVYDHLLRINDSINTFRETLANVVDLYLSGVSNRLNRQVNRLTIITIGIGVLAVITGFYGMNFERTWPPFDAPWGVPFVLAVIFGTVAIILFVVKRQRNNR